MKFAYADPPYPGCAHLYKKENPNASEVDHAELIRRLVTEYPDGWALSTNEPNLWYVLDLCKQLVPTRVRTGPWIKPFASFKPGVNPAWTWEPVIFCGGRKRERFEPTIRDYVIANITLQKGVPGAKPPQVCYWIFEMLNLHLDDEFHDLYPGSGAVSKAWDDWCAFKRLSIQYQTVD